jgi:hypothetical protein
MKRSALDDELRRRPLVSDLARAVEALNERVSRLEWMVDPLGQQRQVADRFRGPWFDSKTAAAYVGCKSINAWYAWRKRHAIVLRGRLVARADLDRAMRVKRLPRRMAATSLANLRKRS